MAAVATSGHANKAKGSGPGRTRFAALSGRQLLTGATQADQVNSPTALQRQGTAGQAVVQPSSRLEHAEPGRQGEEIDDAPAGAQQERDEVAAGAQQVHCGTATEVAPDRIPVVDGPAEVTGAAKRKGRKGRRTTRPSASSAEGVTQPQPEAVAKPRRRRATQAGQPTLASIRESEDLGMIDEAGADACAADVSGKAAQTVCHMEAAPEAAEDTAAVRVMEQMRPQQDEGGGEKLVHGSGGRRGGRRRTAATRTQPEEQHEAEEGSAEAAQAAQLCVEPDGHGRDREAEGQGGLCMVGHPDPAVLPSQGVIAAAEVSPSHPRTIDAVGPAGVAAAGRGADRGDADGRNKFEDGGAAPRRASSARRMSRSGRLIHRALKGRCR